MGEHWKAVDDRLGIWINGYDFNNSIINTIAVRISEGLMVISPGTNPTDELFKELDALGTLKAIVSPGAFHHLGMPAWKERYPHVPLFATSSGLSHIPNQHKGVKLGLQGFDALQPLLPEHVVVVQTPNTKHPDMLMFIRGGDGKWTWFTNEIIGNQPTLPGNFFIRTLFKLTNSGPGLAVTKPALMLIGAKKPELKAFVLAKLDEHPPGRFLPCHGDVIEGADTGNRLRQVVSNAL